MNDIETTLKERGARYGAFPEHARIAQNLKRAMHDTPNWDKLADSQKEALEMIQHKIARALNGDPDYFDNWVDIEGYARLERERLEKEAIIPNE